MHKIEVESVPSRHADRPCFDTAARRSNARDRAAVPANHTFMTACCGNALSRVER